MLSLIFISLLSLPLIHLDNGWSFACNETKFQALVFVTFRGDVFGSRLFPLASHDHCYKTTCSLQIKALFRLVLVEASAAC